MTPLFVFCVVASCCILLHLVASCCSFVLWLQVPLTNGADIGLSLLKRLIGRYVKVRKVVTNVQNSNFILRMLVGFRIITDEQRLVFTEVMSDGSNVILLSMIFLVTPGFVTEVGCLLVGTGYPIYATGK